MISYLTVLPVSILSSCRQMSSIDAANLYLQALLHHKAFQQRCAKHPVRADILEVEISHISSVGFGGVFSLHIFGFSIAFFWWTQNCTLQLCY